MLMMRINRRTDYAVRVMLALAEHPYGDRLSTQSIQDTMLVPRAFLERIIAELSRAKLILTFPGPNGGIQLNREPETITLLQIWDAIEGPLMISDCLQSPEECPLHEDCPVHGCWGRLQKAMQRELESMSIGQLSIEMKKKQASHRKSE
jgi:Rrf2 family protein